MISKPAVNKASAVQIQREKRARAPKFAITGTQAAALEHQKTSEMMMSSSSSSSNNNNNNVNIDVEREDSPDLIQSKRRRPTMSMSSVRQKQQQTKSSSISTTTSGKLSSKTQTQTRPTRLTERSQRSQKRNLIQHGSVDDIERPKHWNKVTNVKGKRAIKQKNDTLKRRVSTTGRSGHMMTDSINSGNNRVTATASTSTPSRSTRSKQGGPVSFVPSFLKKASTQGQSDSNIRKKRNEHTERERV